MACPEIMSSNCLQERRAEANITLLLENWMSVNTICTYYIYYMHISICKKCKDAP